MPYLSIKKFSHFGFFVLCLLACREALAIGVTSRISVTSSGLQGKSDSFAESISADGRFVVFDSLASNLVPGDTNGKADVFVRDRWTSQTTRVSIASDGKQGNGVSTAATISADGRFVAFLSYANNLVAGDTNKSADIFVHDRLTHSTSRVSIAGDGTEGNNYANLSSISADGRFIAFESWATNLVPGDTNGMPDIFIHDRRTHRTTRASIASNGKQGNWSSLGPKISADGRFVAFSSEADNLVPGDTCCHDVFVHDRQGKKTMRVSLGSGGTQAYGNSGYPSISADGRFVVFQSSANNLVSGDTNGVPDQFVYDRLLHATGRISLSSSGAQANNYSSAGSAISADGRFVAFTSLATNLVTNDNNGVSDIFIHDRKTHHTQRVSVASNGNEANFLSENPNLNADGAIVSFSSLATNLVSNDSNDAWDGFVRNLASKPAISTDLSLTITQKPASIPRNGQADFVYTIINNGSHIASNVRILHIIGNGKTAGLQASQGNCKGYTAISLCDLGSLAPGQDISLIASVKGLVNPLRQQTTVSVFRAVDNVFSNNQLNIATPVAP